MALIGILSNKKISHEQKTISKIIEINSLENVRQKVESFSNQKFTLISLSKDEKKRILQKDNYILGIEGDVFNLPSFNQIIERYIKEGDSFIDKLNGNFNIIIYDKTMNDVKFFNDNYEIVKNALMKSFSESQGRHFADKYTCWMFKFREPRYTFNGFPLSDYYFTIVPFF